MIGSFRQRVQVQLKTSTTTAAGPATTWTTVGEDWAKVVVLDAAAQARYQQLGNVEARWKIEFRNDPYRHDPLLNYGTIRFVWRGQVIYPSGAVINQDTRGRYFSVLGAAREEAQVA